MKNKLEIPKEKWHQLIMDRTPKSHQQHPTLPVRFHPRFLPPSPSLSAESSTHARNGDPSETIQILAEVIDLDRQGELPLEDLTDDGDKPYKSMRDSAVQRIRSKMRDDIAMRLHGRRLSWMPCWAEFEWTTREKSDAQVQIFSSADLLPIDEDNPDDKTIDKKSNTMRSLAVRMADLAREWFGNFEEHTNDAVLHRSLGKAATQCSDMETYVRVSVWLFLAATDICYQYDKGPADDKAGEILRKFLRNYMALVLLCEEKAMEGKVTKG